ncbi:MAG: hypothetical protein DME93_04950 [Verrucomicrobia bacterium]|nr:MAG: hypothetical protein DME93_04950 [Verrucomicrobiota bacterium]
MGLFFDLSYHLQRFAVTYDFQLNILVQFALSHHLPERRNILDVAPIKLANDIAGLQLRLCCRRTRHDLIHHYSFVVGRTLR